MSLAEDSLGHSTPTDNPLTLTEKRKQYEDWLKSGRRTDRPNPALHARTDERVQDPILAARREAAHTEAASTLINPLPPGYVVRTDEGDEKVDVSEDVRLRLAGALADKAKDASPEQAVLIANAGHALLAPLTVRADDAKADDTKADDTGTNVKNRILNDGDKPKEFTLADLMTAIDGVSKRMDAIEARDSKKAADAHPPVDEKDGKKAADNDILAVRARLMRGDNRIRIDSMFREDASATYHEGMNEINRLPHAPETADFFAAVQSRADSVYQKLGKSAARPLDGEQLGAYRRRLLISLQPFSPTYKLADLRVLAVDNAGFEVAERAIYQAAADEAVNPRSVPLGTLREIVETRGGHTYTKFYGTPKAWMAPFMPNGRLVNQITVRQDNSEKVRYQARKRG